MSKDGFKSGDFDPAFPVDDKFVHLAAICPDRRTYYEATGAYWHVVAAAWVNLRRPNVKRAAPACSEAAERALIEAGLLDPDGALPGSSFDRWVGVAIARRAGWAERKRLERASLGVSGSPQDSRGQQPPSGQASRSLSRETPVESDGLSGTPPDSRGVTPRAQDRTVQVKTDGRGGAGEKPPAECRDPKAHRAGWIDFAGVGLRCPTCADKTPLPAWSPPASKAS